MCSAALDVIQRGFHIVARFFQLRTRIGFLKSAFKIARGFVELVNGFVQTGFFLKFINPALHVPYATAQRARHLGQVLGPDDHKRDQKDQNQFGKTDVEHGRPILRDY